MIGRSQPIPLGSRRKLKTHQDLVRQIDQLFHPRSVAVVGAPRELKAGKVFLMALLDQKFPGPIYPVNPVADEIDGLKAYPGVAAIPDQVDLAIVLVPRPMALEAVRECGRKGIKGVVLFTSGFKETGSDEGRSLEAEIAREAEAWGLRLLGPNCMGLYCPESGLSFFPQLSRESGGVGFISHSGSLANILARIAPTKGLAFSKAASLGNECDLQSADMLLYLGQDPATMVIGAYLEGVKDGRYFFEALQEASLEKPVILWRVGLTAEGSRAVASHTGALAGSEEIWRGVVRQAGAVEVVGFEALVDALIGFYLLPPNDLGPRMAVISGPGGLAVSAAEACGREGLQLANPSPDTIARLAEFVPHSGTSLKNPIDVGLTASMDLNIYFESIRTMLGDPGVDAVVVMGTGLSPELNDLYTRTLIRISGEFAKPLLVAAIPGFDTNLASKLLRAGVPFFASAERAMHVYALVWKYQSWRSARQS
jgi:acyl-CoA synthetase (NDP forming)